MAGEPVEMSTESAAHGHSAVRRRLEALLMRAAEWFPPLRHVLVPGGFARNVFLLAGGTVAGQLLAVATSPVITRLYTPHDLGLQSVFGSVLGVLGTVSFLSYEQAVPLPREDREAVHVVALCFGILAVIVLLTGVPALFFAPTVASWFGLADLGRYLWALPLALFTLSSYKALSYWAIRKGQFAVLARTKISQGIGQVTVHLGLGAARWGAFGLILGDIVGRGLGGVALGRILARDTAAPLRSVSWSGVRDAAVRYRKFPLLSTGSHLLSSSGLLGPVLIARFYGADVAGWVALCSLVVGGPLSLLSTATADVYLNRSAAIGKNDVRQQEILLGQLVARMAMLCLPFVLFMMATAHWLFPYMFGGQWTHSAVYLLPLAPMYFITAIASPTHPLLTVFERQELHLLREVLRAPLVLGPLLLAQYLSLEPVWGVACFAAGTSLFYLLSMVSVWWVVRAGHAPAEP